MHQEQVNVIGSLPLQLLLQGAFAAGNKARRLYQIVLDEFFHPFGPPPSARGFESSLAGRPTEWDSLGRYFTLQNTGRKGDYVDLLAIVDTLSLLATCGFDIGWTNNFSLKPIRVQVYDASDETLTQVKEIERRNTGFKGQRTPDDFKVNKIKGDRELHRNPNYVPEFVNYPITVKPIQVSLDAEELAKAKRLVAVGLGKDVAEVVRTGVMLWYMRNREPGQGGRLRP